MYTVNHRSADQCGSDLEVENPNKYNDVRHCFPDIPMLSVPFPLRKLADDQDGKFGSVHESNKIRSSDG